MKYPSKSLYLPALLIAAAFLNAGCQTHPGATPASPQPQAALENLFPPVWTKEAQSAMTPPQALAELRAGNLRFVSGKPRAYHPLARVKATASGQYPIAATLSCIDSRQPIELVFDQSIGDVFSARVAGNVLDEDLLGSLEFACKVAGAKLIAVIGHSNCGAIKGAADGVALGNLTELLARIKPAIDRVPAEVQPRNSKNHDFVDRVAEANVRLVLEQIRERSPILRAMIDQGQILLVGGMYDLATGRVHFYDSANQ
ncbi:MAG: carbonic anhydrase family protein [Limisphaerales bacterium]